MFWFKLISDDSYLLSLHLLSMPEPALDHNQITISRGNESFYSNAPILSKLLGNQL